MAAGMLLIAGGVGVTPIRALLEESTVPTVVLYRVSNIGDAVLLRELQELCRQRGAWLQVLAGRTGQGNPPFAPFEPAAARRAGARHHPPRRLRLRPRGDDGVGAAQPARC